MDNSKPENRRLFSLAHELGHLFLHLGYGSDVRWSQSGDYIESYARHGYGEEEFEANEFAAAFLMPESAICQKYSETSSLEDTAQYFKVSVDAASLRLRWLGLEPW